MYSQIDSDFKIPLVQECRGIILEDNTFRVLCMAYKKFFNIQEGHAATIDWDTARIIEKVDGSIIKLWWYDGEWQVSTNSVISAKECTLQTTINTNYRSFYDLFMVGAANCTLDFNSLNKSYTHIFELVGPYNRVIIPYKDIAIYHTGTRDNTTYEELDIDIGVKKPKSYSFKNKEEMLSAAEGLPLTEEGFVVVDSKWNRVKVKGPAYIAMHHLHNNGNVINNRRALELVMLNEQDEVISYFPEYKEHFDKISEVFQGYLDRIKADIDFMDSKVFETRKDYALTAKGMTNPEFMFLLLDGKVKKEDYESWVRSVAPNKILEYLKFRETKKGRGSVE
jgi:T4 RnlA family RNA ligase